MVVMILYCSVGMGCKLSECLLCSTVFNFAFVILSPLCLLVTL